MIFGKRLKELRLTKARIGLRRFAEKISMQPSTLSEIERGLIPPPKCRKWINHLSDLLGLTPNSKEETELYELWSQPFVMQELPENMLPSPLTHKSDGTLMSTDELIDLTNSINSRAKEHNKRAKEYNR